MHAGNKFKIAKGFQGLPLTPSATLDEGYDDYALVLFGPKTIVSVEDEEIGFIIDDPEYGAGTHDTDGVLLDIFIDVDTAKPTLLDQWYAKRGKANGSASTANREPGEQPQSLPVAFLQKLRPDGPWVLFAFMPDNPTGSETKTKAITATTPDQVDTFVRAYNGKRNLYYSLNPTRTTMTKKAAKTDIAAIEYLPSDLDPAKDETSEAAKARYLAQLNNGFEPRPTAGIDSGNGLNLLLKLIEPIILPEPTGTDAKGKKAYDEKTAALIADAEGRAKRLMEKLGSVAGTQNIDRILRLPGTTNLPNAKKRKEGRVACEAKLLWFDDVSYPLDAFPKGGGGKEDVVRPAVETDDDGDYDETGSGYGFRFMQDCHDRKMSYQEACAAILADNTKAGEWANRVDERQLVRAWERSKVLPIDPATTAPLFSEEALALEFAERHANTLRYVAKWGQWLVWDGTCWRTDKTRRVFTLARELCREVAATANKAAERKRIASAKTRAAVVSLAGEDRRLVATIEQWDADPWLLNTPDGVVDLRTGKLRAHRITDYMTKQTAASPKKGGRPKWTKIMQEVTGGDDDLSSYLQRVSGYCLTGVATEQELYFLYGSGNNGKGVWVRAVSGILHDYHETSSIETFTVSHSERHPTELAKLRGARLVTASETEEGRRWAEARIKELTGGDPIDARFMRQDFFTYSPQFKLVLSGNHMPKLRTINKAITRRFNRIPFTVTIPDEQVDKNLTEELKAEWPGILAWMIEGCLEWQRIGLRPSKAVTDATESYLESEDILGAWIDECCVCEPRAWESSERLFGSWKTWATIREEWVGSEKTFMQKLEDRGFTRRRNKEQTKRGVAGLRLKVTAVEIASAFAGLKK